ncbi:MAG TPA: hypothetical protein VFJ02_24990 [Vicinamibacterales bacterium]|nr:hypothetical protein [Vicinamibacterales bacterium]
MKACLGVAAVVAAALFAPASAVGQQMPDPKEIAGIPLPVSDVPAGTVVVRVIRGSLANNIPDQPVVLTVDGTPRTMTTDASGRAQFAGLTAGARVQASTTVGSEKLQSQEFPVSANGGIRVLLVATDPNAQKRAEEDKALAAGPAQPGTVVLGEESRFVFELGDASLSVYNILQIVNTARVPVAPQQPVVFDLPEEATGATILQDSSPQATVKGTRVTVAGPFAPGATLVQFAYSIPYSSGDVEIEQRLPAALNRVIVIAQKANDMRLSSPQITEQREMNAEGHTYILGQGPALPAGGAIAFQFANLPHAPTWPRNVALALAVAILAAGAWASRRTATRPAGDRSRNRLETKRSQLLDELAALERQHRDGRVDPQRYAARRRDLVAALERVYAEIDRQAA